MVSWACLEAAKAVLVVPLKLVVPSVRVAVELASTLAVLVVPSARAVLVVVLVVLLL
jgi:hypothetical protein